MKDDLGDRMKGYEKEETSHKLDSHLPIYARIDGRGFSKFTKGMERPFDYEMTQCMKATAAAVLKATHARAAYVQSDEISLFWHHEDENSQMLFNGKLQKLTSVLAGLATVHFYREASVRLPPKYLDRAPILMLVFFNYRIKMKLPTLFFGVIRMLFETQLV